MWIVTQFMFDTPAFIKWLEEWDEIFGPLPVHAGIAGPANLSTLLKYAARCGVSVSAASLARNPAALKLVGAWNPDQQLADLEDMCTDQLAKRLRAIHLYPFGGLAKAAKWLDND